MRCQILRPDDSFRKITAVIIILAWLIITIRSGSAWLTPVQITFITLLVGQPVLQLAADRTAQPCAELSW
jgi:predicted histidine transporter YuiF (NhaC family)